MRNIAFKMSEDRYRILLDRASDGIVSIDGTGKIIEFNRKAEEIFQYTKDEVIGENLSKLIPKENSPVHKRGISHLIETKEPRIGKTMEVVGVRKDGTLFPHEISVSTFQIDEEPIFTAIIRDISDRKDAEEKIRRQNEELILLNTIARIIGQSIELNQILSSALSFIMETSGGSRGGLFLPENSQWILAAYKDTSQKYQDGKSDPNFQRVLPIVNYVAERGETIIAHKNKSNDPQLPGPLYYSHNMESFICLPLKSKEIVVGVLMMGSEADILFSDEDQELLKSLGNTIGVAIDHARLFAEVKKTNKEIEHEREKLEQLTMKLLVSQEEERGKISRELHDEAGQLLSTLKINLEMIKKQLPGGLKSVEELIAKSTQLVDQSSLEIKRICTNLLPSVLESLGLEAALASYIDGFKKTYGIDAELNSCEIKKRLPFEIERVIYRVVQESVNNVAKHAGATQLRINLIDTPSSIIAAIEDNGTGFDVKKTLSSQETNRGLGLLGIKERVSLVQGKVTIKSEPGQGSIIRLEIPKQRMEEKDG
jgi:PAS domain S-box-containing protein